MLFRKILSIFLCVLISLSATVPVFAGDRLSEAKAEMNACLTRIVQIDNEISQGDARAHQITLELQANQTNTSQAGLQRSIDLVSETGRLSARKLDLLKEKTDVQARVRVLDAEIQNLSNQPQQQDQPASQNQQQGQQTNQNQTDQRQGDGVNGSFGFGYPNDGIVGQSLELRMSIENFGSVPWTFYGAVTIRKPNGSEEDLNKQGVYLSAGSVSDVSWQYMPDQSGTYSIIFGLWKTPDIPISHSNWINNAFSVQSVGNEITGTPSGQLTDQSTDYVSAMINGSGISHGESKVGYPVSFKLNILNTGNTAHDFNGAVTVRHSDGSEFNIPQKSVFLNPNESAWVEFFYYPDRADIYDYILGIWADGEGLTNDGWVNDGFAIANNDQVVFVTPTPIVSQDKKPISSLEENMSYPNPQDNVCRPMTVVKFYSNSDNCKIFNGSEICVSNVSSPSFVRNGKVFMPLRSFINLFGGSVYSDNNGVIIDLGGKKTTLNYGNDLLIVSGVSMISENLLNQVVSRLFDGKRTLQVFKEASGTVFIASLHIVGETMKRMEETVTKIWVCNFGTDVVLDFEPFQKNQALIEENNSTLAFKAKILAALIGISDGKLKAWDFFINVSGALAGAGGAIRAEEGFKLLTVNDKVVLKLGEDIVGYAEGSSAQQLIRSQDDLARLSAYVAKYGDEGVEFVEEMERAFREFKFSIDKDDLLHAWTDSKHNADFWKKLGINNQDELGEWIKGIISDRENKAVVVYKYPKSDGDIYDQFGIYDSDSGIAVVVNKDGSLETAYPLNGGLNRFGSRNLLFQIR